MKILLFSATDLGLTCVKAIDETHQVLSGIVTLPQEFKISYSEKPVKNVRHVSFDDVGRQHNCPVIVYETQQKLEQEIRNIQQDLILVAGWYHLVPGVIRAMAPRGCVGLHASLLPKYRGGAPLVWAMIEGEAETGVSLFYLDDQVDAGDIVGQEKFSITTDDTIATLMEKSGQASYLLLKKYLTLLDDGRAPRVKQDSAVATYYPQRFPEDGRIDWSWSADKIHRFIRAQTQPYPGAFTEIDGKKITLWDAHVEEKK